MDAADQLIPATITGMLEDGSCVVRVDGRVDPVLLPRSWTVAFDFEDLPGTRIHVKVGADSRVTEVVWAAERPWRLET